MNSFFNLLAQLLLRLSAFLAVVEGGVILPVFSIYRYIIGLYLSLKYGTKITFLGGIDTMFFTDDEKTPFNNDAWQIFKGTRDIVELRKRFEQRWLQPKEPDGRWKYIKFRQQVKKELGYYFWIPQTDFRIENHVTLYDGPQLKNKADFEKFLAKHTVELPVEKGILWRVTLVNLPDTFGNKVPEKQFMILYNISHVLCDGVAANRFLRILYDKDAEVWNLPVKERGNLMPRISHWIDILVNGPFEVFRDFFTDEKHALLGPRLTGKKLISISEVMDIQKVKVIKNFFKTTVNDVIYSCVVGAFRRFLVSEGKKIPSFMRFKVPVSLHSTKSEAKLENNLACQCIQIPIEEMNCVERLKKTKKVLDELKNAPFLYVFPLIVRFFNNRFPNIFTSSFVKGCSSTSVVSSMPTILPKRFLGCEAKQLLTCLGTSNGVSGCGMNVTVSTDANTLICAFKVDSGIVVSQDPLDKMVEFFSEEIDELYGATGQKL